MDEYMNQGDSKKPLAWVYNVSTSFEGWKDLHAELISFSGTDDPALSHLPGSNDEEYATMALAGSAIYFAHNVPECSNSDLTGTLQDFIDIYLYGMNWDELYRRHPSWNGCVQNVSRPVVAFHRTQPCGSNYLLQNAFHGANRTAWPWEPSLSWRLNHSNPFNFEVPRYDFFQQLVSRTPYSLGYLPLSSTVKNFKVYPMLMVNNGGGFPIRPEISSLQKNAHFEDHNLNITCEGCWPMMGYGYFVIPKSTWVPKEEISPLSLRSCLNLRAIADFFLWSLKDSVSSRAGGFFTPLSEVKKQQVKLQLSTLSCNGKNVLKTDWIKRIRASNLATFILLPIIAFSASIALGLWFVSWRERKNVKNIKKLSQLGALEDEIGLNAYLMDDIDGDRKNSLLSAGLRTDSNPSTDHSSSPPVGGSPDVGAHSFGSSPGNTSRNNAFTASSGEMASKSNGSPKSDEILAKILIPFADLTIGSVIGSGSFGEVYTGVYKHRVVAIKRIASSRDSHMIASFLQEARAMVSIDHPNILRLLAISIKNPYTYIVSEYCKHGSLEDYLKNFPEKATIQHKLDLMTQAARGIAYLHSKNMTHRDLKPSNLLLTEQLVVKVGDLGTATTSQNAHKTMVGTLDFSAPEVLDGQVYTNSCDVYSFAICLWTMFSNQPLYPGWTMYDIIMKVIPGARPPISAIKSEKLAKLISSCWDTNPSLRPSFDVILKALGQIEASDFVE
jgi:tRNA A-37 threonylcarbamoyl transferase component Bud32/ABC-type phosphate transport system substrate-binding protein